ncbi:MAG: mannose-1-phosphate guanylyltransferase/mannose-6-phosphate isomerase [Lysobacteraceae bacterium]
MLIPVILSGGAGTRLWPASRRGHPKPFMRLGGGDSLLAQTHARAQAVADGGEVLTVTGRDYHALTVQTYAAGSRAGLRNRFLLEPGGRNTAPAILLAALDIAARHGDEALLLVLPADHLIADVDAFVADVAVAAELARAGFLTTFGIRPTHPETGFGYIHAGDAIGGRGGRLIEAFVEKPPLAQAQAFVASGAHYWNAGMFCFSARAVLDQAAESCPQVLAAARDCFAAGNADAEPRQFDPDLFAAQPDISIDYALMEPARRRAVAPAHFDWSDIGSWQAISELGQADAAGNRLHGDVVAVDSRDCYIESEHRLVAAVGVSDLVIVDAGDAVLVADRARSQSVRSVAEQLRQRGHAAAQHGHTVYRPWGSYTVLEDADDCKVKRLTVNPGGILSLQKHFRRSEHWTVVHGVAKVRVGEREFLLQRNESTFIPVDTLHRLENPGSEPIHLIEVQCGDYFGEDDIVRLEDVYGRS